MGRYTAGGVGRDLVAGALAGAAAIWIADKLDNSLYRAGGPGNIRKTEAARPGGMDPAHVLAKRAADKVGVDLDNPKDNAAGHTIHYAMGMGIGALYGLLRGMSPAVTTARGAMFGVAMFILQDEIGNTVMGTAGNPLAYPVRDHARGALVHTLFGVVTDLGTRLLAPWRDEVVVYHGPPLSERIETGRRYLEQGRDYLSDRGREYLGQGRQYLGQSRDYLSDRGRRYLEQGREYLEQGRRYGAQAARDARSRIPDVHAADLARRGQKQAYRLAGQARAQIPEVSTSSLSRLWDRLFG
jgi:hypothetical protein